MSAAPSAPRPRRGMLLAVLGALVLALVAAPAASAKHRNHHHGGGLSVTKSSFGNLPADMGGYASTFDQYGDWRYQQTYGYVWYPRVATEWRPYYYGRWITYPRYG